jgi:hypothetical protein
MSLLCLGFLTGYALAKPTPLSSERKPEPKSTPEASPKAEPAPKTSPTPDTRPAPKAESKARGKTKAVAKPRKGATGKGRTTKGRKGAFTYEMDPNAKWACKQQTVKLEPVWRGAAGLTFAFDIRNEGTADLKIRAKGG